MSKVQFILTAAVFSCIAYAQNEPFALGADISWIQQKENEGVRYYHEGMRQDPFIILKEHGFNYIRLRLFVDPTAKIPGENESPYSPRGYCGLDSTVKMAKRVKAAGMKFLLDFHYSDTWADPGKQYKPMSWQSLTTLAQLSAMVRSYTKEALEVFEANGVLPDMVQVGNEVVSGMIWDVGRNYSPGSWSNFAALVNAGIDGVRDVDQNIKIMMHTINEKNPNGWLTNLKNAGVNRVDVFGLSYYSKWHGQPDSLKKVTAAVARTHPEVKIAVAEYSGFHRKVNDIIYDLPDNKGFGTFVWEPADWNDNGEGKVLFDWVSGTNSGRHSNETLELYPQMAIDYGLTGSSSYEPTPIYASQITTNYKTAQIRVQSTANNTITLENLPNNAKVEIYNLHGKQIYVTTNHFPLATSHLKIPTQTKGIYIIKISTP
ncbi:MAG: glycosyl hydrolase 53 family protein [Fibromonadaceae bacterium]|nr:glycosyl hydrolase 53 family protein [Fibromonadaceae bacterium]